MKNCTHLNQMVPNVFFNHRLKIMRINYRNLIQSRNNNILNKCLNNCIIQQIIIININTAMITNNIVTRTFVDFMLNIFNKNRPIS